MGLKLCNATQSMQSTKAQNYKGPLLMKYFSEFIQKLISSSTYHYQSIHQTFEALASIVFEIFC